MVFSFIHQALVMVCGRAADYIFFHSAWHGKGVEDEMANIVRAMWRWLTGILSRQHVQATARQTAEMRRSTKNSHRDRRRQQRRQHGGGAHAPAANGQAAQRAFQENQPPRQAQQSLIRDEIRGRYAASTRSGPSFSPDTARTQMYHQRV